MEEIDEEINKEITKVSQRILESFPDIKQKINPEPYHFIEICIMFSEYCDDLTISKDDFIAANKIFSDDEDSDFDLPGLRTHVYDFLELPDNYQKLEALKKLEEENLYESKDNINKNQIKKKRNIILDLSKNRQIAISYHEYLTFLRRFHRKDQINFTIPEPFEFLNA